MKGFLRFGTLMAICVLLSSCIFDQPEVLGEMNAIINGENFSTSSPSAELLVNNQDSSQKNLLISGLMNTEGKVITINLTNKINGNDGLPTFNLGTYTFDSDDLNAQVVYTKGTLNYFNIIECEVVITQNDAGVSTVDGNFEALLLSTDGDTARIQNGTFEDVLYRVN